MRIRAALPLAALTAVSLLLTACSGADSKTPDKSTQEYPHAIDLAADFDPDAHLDAGFTVLPQSWDPTESTTNADFTTYTAVYDRLLMTGDDGAVEPMLATSFEPADDNGAMVLTLQEGLSFSDGTPFDADAVKFNLERNIAEGSAIAGELNMISSVEVVDASTVKIHVDGGLGTLAVSLASRGGIMVSPKAADAGTLATKPVGIGAYQATKINPGATVELEKSPDYWDPQAQNVASITYTLMADDQSRFNALQSGDIDVAQINPDQLNDSEGAGMQVVVRESPLFLYMIVNAAKPPFDDPEVRKALNMAIDRKAISDGIYDGHCTPSVQMFGSTSPGYSEKLGDGSEVFGYDPEAAAKILEDAGATGTEFTAVPPNITIYQKIAEVIQQELGEVGLTMNIEPKPPAQMVEEFAVQKSVESWVSQATVLNDPEAVHGRLLTPDALLNPGEVDFTELNAAATAAAEPLDPAERKPLYEKYWDAWVANPPHVIPICIAHMAAAVSPDISGVQMLPDGVLDLRHAALAA
ncbi:ABC transporter substrate-binding protein [Cumulibacter soli]|uniref:ABC transporter substrate-binding protein n=1 Tax=Cumulibacter soli TaxID=2546344 RepID=UPI001067BD6F|nr:ABC transporter substrate-binding protein [Cumulibacter soli]